MLIQPNVYGLKMGPSISTEGNVNKEGETNKQTN